MQQPQQHQEGGGGSPYGAPDMGPFSPPAASSAAMPLSSRSPPSQPQLQPQQQQLRPRYEELAALSGAAAGFPDGEMLGGGSGASGGNRWPREETLALIRIRSEMDATFRDATLKGPLWEDVSRYCNLTSEEGGTGKERLSVSERENFQTHLQRGSRSLSLAGIVNSPLPSEY
jgi:hypothetical protein